MAKRTAKAVLPNRTLTLSPASEYISLSSTTLRAMAKSGVIPASFYGGKYHFKVSDLDNFVTANTVKAA